MNPDIRVSLPRLLQLSVILFLLALPTLASAHIGEQSIIYEGLAGPYPLRVVIRPPGVVPGLAEISVRILQGSANRVTVLPVRYERDRAKKSDPAPDVAERIEGEPNLYNAQLWLMTSGAFSIVVNVDGPAGAGTTIVPINSIATKRLEMSRWFGTGLLAFGICLVVALISIVGAAVRESILAPGSEPKKKWHPRIAMVCAAVVLAVFLIGGRSWWMSVDTDYRNNRLYKPGQIGARVRLEKSQPILQVERLDNPRGRPRLIPDHGKLMHLFLIRSDQSAFAHLHPVHTNKHIYESVLPELPAGNYRLYADVTHESGFAQTLVATLTNLSTSPSPPPGERVGVRGFLDSDDSWQISTQSTDGVIFEWLDRQPLIAKAETSLRFRVLETNGTPAVLEPYLGMQAHAVIEESNGLVFTHLHPFGNISMASQQRFVESERTRAGKQNLEVVCGLPSKGDAVVFPYEFPRQGQYRIWVQVRTHGRIMTAVFDAPVAARS